MERMFGALKSYHQRRGTSEEEEEEFATARDLLVGIVNDKKKASWPRAALAYQPSDLLATTILSLPFISVPRGGVLPADNEGGSRMAMTGNTSRDTHQVERAPLKEAYHHNVHFKHWSMEEVLREAAPDFSPSIDEDEKVEGVQLMLMHSMQGYSFKSKQKKRGPPASRTGERVISYASIVWYWYDREFSAP